MVLQDWSEITILENFQVKLSLDTNILAYLVDKTYPTLDKMYEYIKDCPFTEQVSSTFVLYEFVGIRKKEHFLRKVLDVTNPSGRYRNLSSILKYNDKFQTAELNYSEVREEIIQLIEQEIKQIRDDYNINFNNSEFHASLFQPSKDLHLNSRVSKEDSLVAVSSVLPRKDEAEGFICLLTNDSDYQKFIDEGVFKAEVEKVFEQNGIKKPYVKNIKSFDGVDATLASDDEKVAECIIKFIKNLIIQKNPALYIGKTFSQFCSRNPQIICFEHNTANSIPQNPYLTIIGRNLDFILNTSTPVSKFQNKSSQIINTFPILPNSQLENKLSFEWPTLPNEHGYKDREQEIFKMLHQSGNLIFIHPHSLD